ncbi:hypothetical protein AJ80_09929 [Polytolypa hystricis UAMH7299]|uniref:DNA-directed RNA polymerase n=1 Tax=Polytolypa hystricis (strain UAMH7299) TaxID=1447883 RepID=A0A2B7WGD9_POLH7|nr:hypothetical protein AJ80_09929 [Polytolypa hystricis UAMH7299]
MLSRIAQRRHTLRLVNRSYEQLSLPWLCPALSRCQSQSSRPGAITNIASRAPLKESSATVSPLQSIRTLATATATSDVYEQHHGYIPFEGRGIFDDSPSYDPRPGIPQSLEPPLSFSDLPALGQDESSLIIVNDFLSTRPKALRRYKSIGGDVNEMHANLDVSLSVGMFDRAALLIRRLATVYGPNSPELLDLHNKYLQKMISHMIIDRRHSMVYAAQKWYEVEMSLGGVQPNDTTYALMLKMAIRMLHGIPRDRAVRRYWRQAKEADVEPDVLSLPTLSESDLGVLSEICSEDLQGAALGDLEFDAQPEEPAIEIHPEDLDGTPSPGVRASIQKGLGLISLKESLSLFDKTTQIPYPSNMEGTKEEKDLAYAQLRQRRLEADSVTSAIERWRRESEKGSAASHLVSNRSFGGILYEWHQALVSEIEEELRRIKLSERKDRMLPEDQERCECAPYLRILGPDKLAAVIILGSLDAASKSGLDKGIRLGALVMYLGNAVQEEFVAENMRRSAKASTDNTYAGHKRAEVVAKLFKAKNKVKGRTAWLKMISKYERENRPVQWSPATEAKIGALLTGMLLSATKIPVENRNRRTATTTTSVQPAFRRVYQLERGHRIGYVHVNEQIVAKLRREPAAPLLAKHLPMVCPPRPWTSSRAGGFLEQTFPVLRAKLGDRSQRDYVDLAAGRGDLEQVFAGLNVLGKTGWKVNEAVYNVMLEAWNSGEPVANLAPENPDISSPEKPTDLGDKHAWRDYYRKTQLAENSRTGYHSERCFQNFQLEIAKAYLNETFYLPHNLDFRGRAYPLPPYFNQMGADHCRGLLLFSEGRELGVRGLIWLKIHLANVYGFDKASLQEREQFVMDHLEDVRDSANKGLHGKKWWLEAADPFQCLAACIELTNALNLEDPTQFVSHLPVHQDGSCNGLQHYAALGGDMIGAQQVNLEPSDRPSDVYTGVAEYVKAAVTEDSKNGDRVAKLVDGKITRKIVKQTVMTNVYGVTFLGAIRQVRRQLIDNYPELYTSDDVGSCSAYIARKIFDALSTMFTGAHNIQFWFGDCANRITNSIAPEQIEAMMTRAPTAASLQANTKSSQKRAKTDKDPKSKFRSTVVWTTPLKLPVVQPYRATKSRVVTTGLQTLSIREPHASDVVSSRKQLQAFPPNFIHSLDASHMMLSAIKCDELGLTFSAVHDSFWTHAADIDTMNRVLRDAFVRMHSDDIIGRLAREFETRYSKNMYLAKLHPSSPIGKKIKAWRKIEYPAGGRFLKPTIPKDERTLNELFAEYKRLKLLSSNDPAEQAEGKAMVTAGSIFASTPDSENSFSSLQSLGIAGMGQVSTEQESLSSAEEPFDELEDPTLSSDILAGDVTDLKRKLESEPVDNAAAEAEAFLKQAKKTRPKKSLDIWVWLPLTLPPVPEKGEFDVSRLKDSQYFFS